MGALAVTTTLRRPSVIPDLIDALVSQMTDRFSNDSQVLVQDGLPTSWEIGHWLYVGISDPESTTPTPAATATQEWPLATATGRNESGTLTLVVYVLDGDASMKGARDSAFAILAEVQDVLREGTRLGIPGMVRTNFTGIDYDQGQTEDGALAIITARVEFAARI